MGRQASFGLLVWLVTVSVTLGEQAVNRVELGQFTDGAAFAFVHAGSGDWGIEISGSVAPRIQQPKPARLEVFFADDDIRQLAAGYKTARKSADGVDTQAEIACSNVVFRVRDHWTLNGAVVSIARSVEVEGNAPGSVDEYLDWAVPSYAKLYNLTKDQHYLDIARASSCMTRNRWSPFRDAGMT